MKIFRIASNDNLVGRASPRAVIVSLCRAKAGSRGRSPHQSGFTMVEIAISLAIIGIALVGILAVLPLGLNVQRDNREQTIINQDATIFVEDIRNGSRGADDLTNYVYAITNSWGKYDPSKPSSGPLQSGINGYSYLSFSALPPFPTIPISSGARIVELLSTPKYQSENSPARGGNPYYISNHVVAYVRSLSGPAEEKPPQDNDILRGDSFSYRIICDNVPVEIDPNATNSIYNAQLTANLHELRLTFLWPQLPNGRLGRFHQTFRALIAGQVVQTNDADGNALYYFQPQSFVNATNAP